MIAPSLTRVAAVLTLVAAIRVIGGPPVWRRAGLSLG